MKHKLLYGALGTAFLTILTLIFIPAPKQVEVSMVRQGRFERVVEEDGKTRLCERYIVSAPWSGIVMRINLKQGDVIARGTAIATLQPAAPTLLDARSRAEQLAHIGAAQAGLARSRANVQGARAALEQARAELRRIQELARRGFVANNQTEVTQLNVHLRQRELESAQQEEIVAIYQLEQARIAVEQFINKKTPQKTYIVSAPASGKILKVLQQSEGVVTAGTPLIEFGDPSCLEVVAEVLTEDASQIKPGAVVQLSNWGGSQIINGRVRLVEPAAFTKVSALGVEEQRVNTIIDIISPAREWESLGDGFKVDVRILVQAVNDVTLVPVSALFPWGTRSALFAIEKGQARLRVVDIAARNEIDTWVQAGVTPGTQVIVYPDTQLKDGDRVKIR